MRGLFFSHLSRYGEIVHVVTTRDGGVSLPPFDSLNLALHVGDDPATVMANRAIVAQRLGIDSKRLIFANQVHGNRVVEINSPPKTPITCDALITNKPGFVLGVMIADCVPLIFYDPQNQAIGVAHAGWRGTLLKIAIMVVQQMAQSFKTRARDLLVGIGPSIGGSCYEVDEKVAKIWLSQLPKAFHSTLKEHGRDRWLLDLQLSNQLMLQEAGVPSSQIETISLCTHCERSLYSHRRDQKTGRFAALIGLK